MKFFSKTAGYILFDHKKEEEVLEEMKVLPVDVNCFTNQIDYDV
jgi:hypothetical protein